MITSFFYTLGFAVKIYSYLCIFYIFISWFRNYPQRNLLDEICSPYLNWFKRFRFTQIGMVDFSPILALGLLSLISRIFFRMAIRHNFSFIDIIISLIGISWSFFSFLLNFFIILLLIRLILDMSQTYRAGNFTTMLDRFLAPVFVKVHKLSGGRFMSLRKQVIVCILILLLLRLILGALFGSIDVYFKYFNII